MKRSGRLATMKDVPYRTYKGYCRHSSKPNGMIAFRVTGYTKSRGGRAHVQALATKGPLSVGYTLASDFFQYTVGIYRNSWCMGRGKHAVTNVGYTSTYFLMKNSWGAGWDEGGYFRIARGNVCGITNMGFGVILQSTGKTDPAKDEDMSNDGNDGNDNNNGYQSGFKKCPDGRCVHEHWTC